MGAALLVHQSVVADAATRPFGTPLKHIDQGTIHNHIHIS
jgi:hypothetical protein